MFTKTDPDCERLDALGSDGPLGPAAVGAEAKVTVFEPRR